jgi:hypothetical protein
MGSFNVYVYHCLRSNTVSCPRQWAQNPHLARNINGASVVQPHSPAQVSRAYACVYLNGFNCGVVEMFVCPSQLVELRSPEFRTPN